MTNNHFAWLLISQHRLFTTTHPPPTGSDHPWLSYIALQQWNTTILTSVWWFSTVRETKFYRTSHQKSIHKWLFWSRRLFWPQTWQNTSKNAIRSSCWSIAIISIGATMRNIARCCDACSWLHVILEQIRSHGSYITRWLNWWWWSSTSKVSWAELHIIFYQPDCRYTDQQPHNILTYGIWTPLLWTKTMITTTIQHRWHWTRDSQGGANWHIEQEQNKQVGHHAKRLYRIHLCTNLYGTHGYIPATVVLAPRGLSGKPR